MDRRQVFTPLIAPCCRSSMPFSNHLDVLPVILRTLRRNVGYYTDAEVQSVAGRDDAMVIIDSQYPQTAKNLLNGLQDRSDAPLDLLINTHHHGDHTGGNPALQWAAKTMAGHENVPKLMKKAAEQSDGRADTAYPRTTYSDSWQMDLGDERLHAKYYGPGHTSGDSVIYFEKANVVHMGDLVFNRMNPYTDRTAGASIMNWIKILEEVANEYPADAMYIFGHGKPEFGVEGTKEDLGVMQDYLSAVIEHVRDGIEQGLSKEEITDQQVLDGFENFLYADFWTLPDNLGVAYEEVTQS
ncbi:MAG: MBL fold metallo-hydrolase [Fodinibius sp.]|nr:MBL fold metallo-hydrolase [Fodinibius sp.]